MTALIKNDHVHESSIILISNAFRTGTSGLGVQELLARRHPFREFAFGWNDQFNIRFEPYLVR
jgi:hypothetical protein